MRVIKDLKGRQWELQITVGTIKRVRSKLDMDLYNIGDEGFIKTIIDDPIKLIELFWVILEDEVEKQEIDEAEFCKGWAGEVIEIATNLFIEELIEFFPPKKRMPVEKMWKKLRSLEEKVYKKVEIEVENISEDDILDTAMEIMKTK